MNELPNVKRYHGFTYRRIESVGPVGHIYAQERGGRVIAYEVFRSKIRPPGTRTLPDGRVIATGGERWPSNEDFGKWAWTFRTLDKARARLAELIGESISVEAAHA